jgi:hypothetical protein
MKTIHIDKTVKKREDSNKRANREKKDETKFATAYKLEI